MNRHNEDNEVTPEQAMIQVKVNDQPVMTAVMNEDEVADVTIDDTTIEIWRVGAAGPPDGWHNGE